ncbi:MAG: site-specific integrase [Acidobacteriaceae bacterium]|nr:site-specific integrase [Acidobacteriaceae bacterium]
MKTARYQNGCVMLSANGSGEKVWLFRWYETQADGQRIRRKKVVGTQAQLKNKAAAEKAAARFRLAINSGKRNELSSSVTMSQLIVHFRERELADLGDDGRAYSTRDRYECTLNAWIEPRWGSTRIDEIKTPMVEEWLRDLHCRPRRRKKTLAKIKPAELKRLAPGTKAKIRNLMSVLYNHAIRWGFIEANPISGPVKGSGVRQSSKREKVPDILEVEEIQNIVAELGLRERVLVFLDMASGLRRGELAGLKWLDIDFDQLDANVQRSIVDQVVGRCKTEASQKRIPLDEDTAQDLLAWYRETPFRKPDDYVFATASNRAGKMRGKQPIWLSTVMRYHIQPVVKRLGINKRVSWHTFRRTYSTLLQSNREDVKVVQELLRHGSAKVTLDVYSQAQMPAKREAQRKVVAMVRPEAAHAVAISA